MSLLVQFFSPTQADPSACQVAFAWIGSVLTESSQGFANIASGAGKYCAGHAQFVSAQAIPIGLFVIGVTVWMAV